MDARDDLGEGVQVELVQVAGIDLRIGAATAVAAAGGDAVRRKMLQAGGHALTLDARGHLRAQFGDEEGILAVGLDGPAPALVARHVQDGGIDAVVADQARLLSGDLTGPADHLPVPAGADADRSRQGRCERMVEAVDALVGEFGRDAQPGLFHEELLDLMQGLDVVAEGIDQVVVVLIAVAHAVEMLVDVGDAVLPYPFFPFRGRKGPGQDAPVAIDRHQLAGLLIDRHLREQVFHALFHASGGVFVDVLDTILVEVYPSFVVDGFLLRACGWRGLRGGSQNQKGRQGQGLDFSRNHCRK